MQKSSHFLHEAYVLMSPFLPDVAANLPIPTFSIVSLSVGRRPRDDPNSILPIQPLCLFFLENRRFVFNAMSRKRMNQVPSIYVQDFVCVYINYIWQCFVGYCPTIDFGFICKILVCKCILKFALKKKCLKQNKNR